MFWKIVLAITYPLCVFILLYSLHFGLPLHTFFGSIAGGFLIGIRGTVMDYNSIAETNVWNMYE